MNISFSDIPRLSEQVYNRLIEKQCIVVDEGSEDLTVNLIMNILHEDLKVEEKALKEAKRMLESQQSLANDTESTESELLEQIKKTIARTRGLVLSNGKERAENQANLLIKALWKTDYVDLFVDDNELRIEIFYAIQNFINDSTDVEKEVKEYLGKHYSNLTVGSAEWKVMYDKYLMEFRNKRK